MPKMQTKAFKSDNYFDSYRVHILRQQQADRLDRKKPLFRIQGTMKCRNSLRKVDVEFYTNLIPSHM